MPASLPTSTAPVRAHRRRRATRAPAATLVLLAVLTSTGIASAQMQVVSGGAAPYDPESLIRDVFLGDGVDVESVTFDGVPIALGYFENAGPEIGLDRGIILSNGRVGASANPGDGGVASGNEEEAQFDNGSTVRDPNLERIVPYAKPDGAQNIFNVSRYRITFRPRNNHVSFRYVFASDEYPEFVCGTTSDLFGFFLSGPSIAGPFEDGAVNLALVPGTTLPVSVNSVNNGSPGPDIDPSGCAAPDGSLANATHYRANDTPGQQPIYDGLTKVFTAAIDVVPCELYTIELTIGDVGDQTYDSGVFLEAESLSSPVLSVAVETPASTYEIAEGCDPGRITFTLDQPAPSDYPIDLTVGGTATAGVDYDALPPTVTIPAGATTVSLPLRAIADNVSEGAESIAVTVDLDPCTTAQYEVTIVDRRIAPVPPMANEAICPGGSVVLDATLPTSVPGPATFTSNEFLGLFKDGDYVGRDIEVAGLPRATLEPGAIASICINVSHARMSDLDFALSSPAGRTIDLSRRNGGDNASDGQYCFTPDATRAIDDPGVQAPYTGDYLPESGFRPLEQWGDPANGTWTLFVRDNVAEKSGSVLGWSITLAPAYGLDYAWSPATGLSCADCASPTASPSATTDYTVTVTDSYGCTETATTKVAITPAPLSPAITCTPGFDEVTFNWPADPAAVSFEVSTDGGANYVDVGPALTYTVNGLGVGVTASLRVRALGTCENAVGSASCTTQNCPVVVLTSATTPATCGGYADGIVELTATGGVGTYTYTLGTSSNITGDFVGLAAGTYDVSAADQNGCRASAKVTVGEPTPMTTATAVTPSAACGDPYAAQASASGGGGAPYSFVWSDGQSGALAGFGVSGKYYVTVTDGTGCEAQDSVTITVPEVLRARFPIQPINCAGSADGVLEVLATGGSGAYEYGLDGVYGSNATFASLSPGRTYVAEVRDARGCLADTTFTLAEPAPITLTPTLSPPTCTGDRDGGITVAVTGTRGPRTLAWTGRSEATASLTDLAAGSYELTVRDSAGCSQTATYTLTAPPVLTASAKTDSLACDGDASGVIRVATLGGTRPLSFAIQGGAPQPDSVFGGLPAGAYVITVADANGCRTTVNADVGAPASLKAWHQVSVVNCAGDADGGIDLRVEGGRKPYTYRWSDGPVTEDRSGLSAGAYAVVVTDASGCTLPYEVTLEDQRPVRLNAGATDVTCFGYGDGAIITEPTGGRGTYTFAWTGPDDYAFFGPRATRLAPGTYRLSLRDANGCGIDTAFVIAEPTAITLATMAGDSICNGARDGRAWVTVSGGTAPFTYEWANGETTDTAYALLGGVAAVSVSDARSCVFDADVRIEEVPALTLTLQQTPVRCFRDSNGVARVTELRYGARVASLDAVAVAWRGSPDSTRTIITGRGGGEEAVAVITDGRGCTATDSVVIGEPAPVSAELVLIEDVSCYGERDGTAEVSVSGGVGGYGYAWSTDASADARNANLPAGETAVYVSDANACLDTATLVVRQPDSLTARLTAENVNCFAPNTGRLSADIAGGNMPYRYRWAHGPQTRALDSVTAGTYALVVTDARGCEQTSSAEVLREVAVAVDADVLAATCAGETDGSIVVSATGGNGPYRYLLDQEAPSRFGDFRFLAPGLYTVSAEDRDGCPSPAQTVEVEAPQPIIVEAGGEVAVELGDTAALRAEVYNAVGDLVFQWMPRDSNLFDCPTCPETGMVGAFQGVVRVDVTDGRGCTGSDLVRVRVTKSAVIRVPTGFTPDDDGADDRLLVHGTTGTRVKRLEIFNRWGQLVFAADDFLVNDLDVGWDGTYLGTFAPAGTYVYRVQAIYPDGALDNVSGQTTLIR